MNTLSYTQQAIQASPLLDEAQWQVLCQELGLELLQDCAQEFLQEVHEEWVQAAHAVLVLDKDQFCAKAHKSAGAAGTVAFARLRQVFLCFEQGGKSAQTADHLAFVSGVLLDTQACLRARTHSP